MIVLTLLLITCVPLFICYWIQIGTRKARLLNKFPQLKHFIPVIGHVANISRDQDKIYEEIRQILGSFKETFVAWASIYGLVNIVTAEDAEIILSSTKYIDKGTIYEGLQCWLGTGLLTSTAQKWHQRRKMLTPSFHYNVLQIFVKIFGECSENFVKKLKSMENTQLIDIKPLISKLTLAIICETSMGIKMDENDQIATTYYDSLYTFAKIVVQRAMSPWLYSDFVYYNFSPLAWKQCKVLNFMHEFTKNVIKRREEVFKDSDISNLEKNNGILQKKRLAMLDLLIFAKRLKEIDDIGVREEVDTFIFEGHDTTSTGLVFTLLLLANYKDIQYKVFTELNEIFGDSDRHATYEDLQHMKYLECCIKESLRLYPSVPIIMRKPKEDIQLTHHIVPAGVDVVIHIYNIHRDPRYFPDPEKFDPERFLPENSKGRHPYTYNPFSAGPRNCIGQKFAMFEMKSVISAVLRNFSLEAVDSPKDLKFLMDFVLRVNGSMNITFIPRT